MTDKPAPQTPAKAVIGAVALIEHSVEHGLLDDYLHWVLLHALGHDRCWRREGYRRIVAERDRLREAIRAHRDGYHETIGMADVEARDMRRGELDAVLWAALDGEVSA